MTPTDGETIYDRRYYQRLAEEREATMPPSLAAIEYADRCEGWARVDEEAFPEVQEPRYVADALMARHFDGGGCYLAPWALDSGVEWMR